MLILVPGSCCKHNTAAGKGVTSPTRQRGTVPRWRVGLVTPFPAAVLCLQQDPGTRISMISQQLLDILRCPLNPRKTTLEIEGNRLVCQQCHLRFKIKDGFPSLVAEEA